MSGFARWWTEAVAVLGDLVPSWLLLLVALLLAAAVALVWTHWARLRSVRLRWPLRRRRRRPATEPAESDDAPPAEIETESLPDLPAATFVSRADQFAAQGRWAEAVRERLRAMVRLLVDRRVIEHHPGWTVTELASAAASRAPATDRPLGEAGTVFSDIWYGQRPATADDDAAMKDYASDVDRAASGARPGHHIPASRRGES